MKNIRKLFGIAVVVAILTGACVQRYDSESDFLVGGDGFRITIIEYLGKKQKVNIPPSIQDLPVTSIEDKAFEDCTNLTSIIIPDSVTSIGYGAFIGCTNLAGIQVAASNKAFTAENGVLYDKYQRLLHTYPAGKTDLAFTIPDSVTGIGHLAFEYCVNLISITIPDGVTSIGYFAFDHCIGLTHVTIPASVSSIGRRAFSGCTSLASVTLKGTIPSDGFYPDAFNGNLRSIFYATDVSNGTPGTYIATAPAGGQPVWVRQ